ncbi:hypothetical protein Plhal304r1_c013g0049811 [Plasmopara halstedii]
MCYLIKIWREAIRGKSNEDRAYPLSSITMDDRTGEYLKSR